MRPVPHLSPAPALNLKLLLDILKELPQLLIVIITRKVLHLEGGLIWFNLQITQMREVLRRIKPVDLAAPLLALLPATVQVAPLPKNDVVSIGCAATQQFVLNHHSFWRRLLFYFGRRKVMMEVYSLGIAGRGSEYGDFWCFHRVVHRNTGCLQGLVLGCPPLSLFWHTCGYFFLQIWQVCDSWGCSEVACMANSLPEPSSHPIRRFLLTRVFRCRRGEVVLAVELRDCEGLFKLRKERWEG